MLSLIERTCTSFSTSVWVRVILDLRDLLFSMSTVTIEIRANVGTKMNEKMSTFLNMINNRKSLFCFGWRIFIQTFNSPAIFFKLVSIFAMQSVENRVNVHFCDLQFLCQLVSKPPLIPISKIRRLFYSACEFPLCR